jgi:hypothetical protein
MAMGKEIRIAARKNTTGYKALLKTLLQNQHV